MKWRLLLTGHNDAYYNMAVDEAIMRLHPIIQKPTIRLYGWSPAAVSIGCFQSLELEVDEQKCMEQNVDVVRRITGGGAVFHDKEVTYSFVCNAKDAEPNILTSYKKICNGVIQGLHALGIQAEFMPMNDILVDGKKISGNAQTRRDGVLLQHGTILLDTDVDTMFSLLKVPDEKMRHKTVQSVKKRVTSVLYHLGHAEHDEVVVALKTGFEREFNITLEHENLTDQEITLAKQLIKERFANEAWTQKR